MRCLSVALLFCCVCCLTSVRGAEPIKPQRSTGAAHDVGWQASGKRGAVVAGGAEAVDAGMLVLRNGGNAADAAAATILALSVTDSSAFCFGGEVPIIVYDAKRKVTEVVAGMGTAPRLATREYFESKGGIPRTGLAPAAVPSALDACLTVLARYGTRTFTEAVAPTLALLDRREQPWHADLAVTLRRLTAAERPAGDRQRGLRLVADCFYRGPIAHELAEWSKAHGGLLRASDLATHVTRIEEPATIEYRGYTIVKCGPWTQGPYLLQALQMLEAYDLGSMGQNSPEAIHHTLEAMKLALADRDTYYADPLFADVPLDALLAPAYAAARRKLIDPNKASLVHRPGDPRSGKALAASANLPHGLAGLIHDTTTCLTADSEGNVVAATPSGWDGVVAGKTGVWLGTRLQSFNLWPDHPNCIEPGKRPRITLTPTLVLKAGKPVMAVSVAGGDGQDQVTLQLLIGAIEFHLDAAQAVTAARFNTNHFVGSFGQTPPELGSLQIYDSIGESTLRALRSKGHKVSAVKPPLWHPTMLQIDRATGVIEAAGDPKAGRHAAAF